jgi:hypothetical protein
MLEIVQITSYETKVLIPPTWSVATYRIIKILLFTKDRNAACLSDEQC